MVGAGGEARGQEGWQKATTAQGIQEEATGAHVLGTAGSIQRTREKGPHFGIARSKVMRGTFLVPPSHLPLVYHGIHAQSGTLKTLGP